MRAVTRIAEPRPPTLDLNDIARGDGFLFVRDGVGSPDAASRRGRRPTRSPTLLASIDHDDTHGLRRTRRRVAIGWVPFEPGGRGELVVPGGHRAQDGRRAAARDRRSTAPPSRLPAPHPPSPSASAYTIEPVTPVDHYLAAVAATRDAVRDGRLTKAVIAREIAVTADRPIDRHGVLHRLKASFGSSYRYAVDGLIGASPELLVEVDGEHRALAPAGRHGAAHRRRDASTPRSPRASSPAPRTRSSTASSSTSSTTRCCRGAASSTGSRTRRSSRSPTCSTSARGSRACCRRHGRTSSSWSRALSPTPALGGHPRDEALALIAAVEGVDRGRYGGAVGWVDAAGNGTWAVAIRCAELSPDGRRARLLAGGGIVADSDPLAELAETQAKFQAMLSALIRP